MAPEIVFISNFFNPHQQPLSDALHAKADSFRFIALSAAPAGLLGRQVAREPAYVLHYDDDRKGCVRAIGKADVLILGSVGDEMLTRCTRTGKIVFFYSERPLKNGSEPLKYLPRLLKWHRQGRGASNCYLLSAGAFAAGDYQKFRLFRGRSYRWGYFPAVRDYAQIAAGMADKDTREILWCGRFLDWKHPDAALRTAARLQSAGEQFHLKMIGDGPMMPQIRQMVQTFHLEETVSFTGPLPPDQVRRSMEKAGIFLFTSDRQEGWGAVLNEAMNSGCAAVGSDAAGAVPYLMQDGENGAVYHSGDENALYEITHRLLRKPDEQKRLGLAACRTICSLWNAQTAADRLLHLIDALSAEGGSPDLYDDGPCSRAGRIDSRWFVRQQTGMNSL